MSARGDYLALSLARLGVPVSDKVRAECARVARCAVRLIRLETELANGPEDRRPGWDVERWQLDLERATERAESRFAVLMGDLRGAVALADSDGAKYFSDGGNRFFGGWVSSLYGVELTVYRNGNANDPRRVDVVE